MKRHMLSKDPAVAVSGGRIPLPVLPPQLRAGSTFAALRHRNYRLYFFGQMVSLVGTWMQIVAQGWLVYQLTNSPLYLGLVGFAASVPVLILSLSAGVLIDRLPRRPMLLATQSSAMLLALVLAALVFANVVQPWHILVLSFALGIVNAFDGTARQTFVKDMVGQEDLMNAIALNSATFNVSRIIGPALAGITLAVTGAGWCFALNGLSFLAVLGSLFAMRMPAVRLSAPQTGMLSQIREGLSYIRHDATVLPVMALVMVSSIFGFSYNTLLPALAEDTLKVGAQGLGMLSTAVGLGALVGALLVASLGGTLRKGLMLTIGNLLFPATLCLLAISQNYNLSLLILVGVGLGFMIQNATANTMVQANVPDILRGRVMSVYMLAFFGMSPLGSLQAGFVAQRFGVLWGIGVGAVLSMLFSLYLLWRVPHLRHEA